MLRCLLFIPTLLLPLCTAARERSLPEERRVTEYNAAPAREHDTAGGLETAREFETTGEFETAGEFGTTGEHDTAGNSAADTLIRVDEVQVTAIKQGLVLRSQPVAASIVGGRAIARGHVDALKDLSQTAPNLHIPDYGSRMTSSIYVRGLGARIDQPVIGLNIDNVPVLNKNDFDMEIADAERIEVLRGPQSTLYGRNTMGGVVNVYTLSPLTYEGVRLLAEYGSGNTCRVRASSYYRATPDLGLAVTGYYTRSDGFFENRATGEPCDWERMGGGRWKMQWRGRRGLKIDNTLSLSVLDEGGYPYAYAGRDLIGEDGKPIIRHGEIRYNDPSAYRRTTVSDGLTIRYDAERFSVSSITSYRYSDDCMTLDQDFLPLSYFTLRQALREHSVTEDVVFRSRGTQRYRWLLGAFGFYRHGRMSAPVHFKKTGIEELIEKNANEHLGPIWGESYTIGADELPLLSDFRNPVCGGALYHESELRLGRWHLTAALRIDVEHTALRYRSRVDMDYTAQKPGEGPVAKTISIDDRHRIAHTFCEVLPKFSALYAFDETRNLYVSVSKGYKAGGFNTQLFSDILSEKLKWRMAGTQYDEPDLMSYEPEQSWNYELGGHFSCMEGAVRGDFALFYIDVRNQQLTVFPEGQSTGRMMTNAGRTRSFGAELSLQVSPWRALDLNVAYGYTNARFVRYDDGKENFRGNYLPYAPQHTLSARATWTHPTGVAWLGDVVLQAGVRCTGDIYWNEANSLRQPFYALTDASVRIEHRHYTIDLWGRNLTGTPYDVFYFKSIGNEFVQRGRPRTFGITLSINID